MIKIFWDIYFKISKGEQKQKVPWHLENWRKNVLVYYPILIIQIIYKKYIDAPHFTHINKWTHYQPHLERN